MDVSFTERLSKLRTFFRMTMHQIWLFEFLIYIDINFFASNTFLRIRTSSLLSLIVDPVNEIFKLFSPLVTFPFNPFSFLINSTYT